MKTELVASHQNVETNESALSKDHQGAENDAGKLLKELSGATVETLALARAKIDEKLSNAKSSVEAARISIAGKAHDAADNVYGYVKENPWKVFGVAAAAAVAGVIVGIILNRR